MAKKNTLSNGESQTKGEISVIRDILMGSQMSDYETRFNQLDQRLDQLEETFHQRIDQLANNLEQQRKQSEKDFSDRIEKIEALLLKNMGQLNDKIDQVTNDDKKKLGKMMAELSQKLIGE